MAAESSSNRKAALAEAVVAIVATRGIDAVSVREVAARLEVSVGAVQHHFSTKAEMMAFAFDHTVGRIRARLATLELSGDPARDIALVLAQLLPLDDVRREEAVIHLGFASLATTTPRLQSIQASLLDGIRDELVDVLGEGRAAQAAMLLAAVDGLALHAVSAPGTSTAAQLHAALAAAVDAALGGAAPDRPGGRRRRPRRSPDGGPPRG